jgi:hypothetical protein
MFKKSLALVGIVFLIVPMSAMAVFDFDGMPIDISESDFLTKRPSANLLNEYESPNKSTTYIYPIEYNHF